MNDVRFRYTRTFSSYECHCDEPECDSVIYSSRDPSFMHLFIPGPQRPIYSKPEPQQQLSFTNRSRVCAEFCTFERRNSLFRQSPYQPKGGALRPPQRIRLAFASPS